MLHSLTGPTLLQVGKRKSPIFDFKKQNGLYQKTREGVCRGGVECGGKAATACMKMSLKQFEIKKKGGT